MIKNLILILTIYPWLAFSCHLTSFDRIVKLNKVMDQSIIKSSDCTPEVQSLFIDFISSAEGVLKAKHLASIFSNEYNINIEILPNAISIEDSATLIQKNLKLENTLIKNINSLYGNAAFTLNQSDRLVFSCSNCNKPGEHNIKAYKNGETIWMSASIYHKKRALVLTKDINPFNPNLDNEDVEYQYVFDKENKQLFSDYENIKFYKPTRTISKGDLLKVHDLSLKRLINYNSEVEVSVKGKDLFLKSKALAKETGVLGQIIKLYNPKTKKIMEGKVIDYNKVMVEL